MSCRSMSVRTAGGSTSASLKESICPTLSAAPRSRLLLLHPRWRLLNRCGAHLAYQSIGGHVGGVLLPATGPPLGGSSVFVNSTELAVITERHGANLTVCRFDGVVVDRAGDAVPPITADEARKQSSSMLTNRCAVSRPPSPKRASTDFVRRACQTPTRTSASAAGFSTNQK